MTNDASWSKEQEARWKSQIENLFAEKLQAAYAHYGDPLEVGNHLGEILPSVELDAVKLVVPRAARKWASSENRELWESIISDETKLLELRAIGTSVANTLRPLAGNTFAQWVADVLNTSFQTRALPLTCQTSGQIKKQLSKSLVIKTRGQSADYKPDIDVVVVNMQTGKPVAILSAKTTLAERVLQTITWKRYRDQLPKQVRAIRIFLVTAWETFETDSANRSRVQELDGVYVCNANANFQDHIKPFSALIQDLEKLL
ncbi:hypothetical protein FBQ82_14230 [Anaerolineae bacterium CFX7]|nr:hypothetical protein [Anaerolineae bacterium CFX7]